MKYHDISNVSSAESAIGGQESTSVVCAVDFRTGEPCYQAGVVHGDFILAYGKKRLSCCNCHFLLVTPNLDSLAI